MDYFIVFVLPLFLHELLDSESDKKEEGKVEEEKPVNCLVQDGPSG